MGGFTALRTLVSVILVVAPLSTGLHLHPAKPFVDRAQAVRILSNGVLGGVASTIASQAARASGDNGAMVMHETNEWKFSAPASFKVSNKPLKTHLEEVNVKSETRGYYAGVAVDAIKLESLQAFGTPEFVGGRVVGVENKKDGVLAASLLGAGSEGPYYDIEYTNESTHGNNHYKSRIAVQNGKLFVFTVQCKQGDYETLADEMVTILNSFALKAYPT